MAVAVAVTVATTQDATPLRSAWQRHALRDRDARDTAAQEAKTPHLKYSGRCIQLCIPKKLLSRATILLSLGSLRPQRRLYSLHFPLPTLTSSAVVLWCSGAVCSLVVALPLRHALRD